MYSSSNFLINFSNAFAKSLQKKLEHCTAQTVDICIDIIQNA